MQDVFEAIKKGIVPPRARDRGLSVRHLKPFIDPSIWSDFSDNENVENLNFLLTTLAANRYFIWLS
jgi:hypothetical protein